MFGLLIGLAAFPLAAWYMFLGWLWYTDARKAVKWRYRFGFLYDDYEDWRGKPYTGTGKPSHPVQAVGSFVIGILMIVAGIYFWLFVVL